MYWQLRWRWRIVSACLAVGGLTALAVEPHPRSARAEPPAREAANESRGSASPEQPAAIAEANNKFALDLYRQLRQAQPGNLFFSPSSISTALAMTAAGARGETAAEMAQMLHLPQTQEVHAALHAFLQQLNAQDSGYQLVIANRLWGQQGYQFQPDFLETTKRYYNASLVPVDFRQSEKVRQTINDWVGEATQGKISDLIPPGALDELSRLVLTNAIYFKGKWQLPFAEQATQQALFHTSPQKSVAVPLMSNKGRYAYGMFGDWQLVELPYTGEKLSMMVLLPSEGKSLAELAPQLSPQKLQQWAEGLRPQEVQVYLPRFKMTAQFGLKETLQQLGMRQAFDAGKADFSGIASQDELFISAVIHKAYVEVNEEGTEAAAATGVVVGVRSLPPPPVIFRADRPFVFLIRDRESGAILFLGQLIEP